MLFEKQMVLKVVQVFGFLNIFSSVNVMLQCEN